MSASAASQLSLSSKLAEILSVPPISIELLPGDGSEWITDHPSEHAPFLFIDHNLGVPQKAAYKAYLEAVPRFRNARQRLLQAPHPPLSDRDIAEAAASSSVLLLINPAHQSALNARKDLVCRGLLDPTHELRSTNAILTLREGAKQSILWQHRRWLLRRIHPPSIPRSPAPGLGDGADSLDGTALNVQTFRAEFAVLEKACEVYPRNYHAWAHRFLCAQALVSLIRGSEDTSPPPGGGALVDVLREEIARIRLWIERHVSDYSAMQYYCQLEGLLLPDSPLRTLLSSAEDPVDKHALEIVCAYPKHESLWLYLRWSLSFVPCTPDTLTSAKQGGASTLADKVLSAGAVDDRAAQRHAVWFVAWLFWTSNKIRVNSQSVRRIAVMAEGSSALTVTELVACLRDSAE